MFLHRVRHPKTSLSTYNSVSTKFMTSSDCDSPIKGIGFVAYQGPIETFRQSFKCSVNIHCWCVRCTRVWGALLIFWENLGILCAPYSKKITVLIDKDLLLVDIYPYCIMNILTWATWLDYIKLGWPSSLCSNYININSFISTCYILGIS